MITLEDSKTADNDDSSLWTAVNDPEEVEFLLRLRNRRLFGQSKHEKTPFTQEPLKIQFNWSATVKVQIIARDTHDSLKHTIGAITPPTHLRSTPSLIESSRQAFSLYLFRSTFRITIVDHTMSSHVVVKHLLYCRIITTSSQQQYYAYLSLPYILIGSAYL